MADVVIENQTDASRYALSVDGELVSVLDYRVLDAQISFPHTFTKPHRRGQGWAEKLVEFAIDDVEQNSARRVVPMCWYVAEWFDAHPERAGLLTR
ncbi:GNAT family N-acetyltransferase [Schumannella sp. 10F1B-5-1]|uniref:GNAT family N-acetyltransferase n=1 Tax=Schumannella sp. 10F1B-5-1 TaxID=2590780 RepID=UPI0011311A89|nr:GNAT family N-acetyltransferase [Schumannella sp. 10F1B-5-1]TPW73497.1 N-acetyltransferase [Schumannella sp. 10F1B-5-1]